MNNKLENEIKELLDSQLRLTKVLNDSEYIIEGVYKYSLCHDGYITQGEKNIKLKKISLIVFLNFMYTIIQKA